MSRNRLMRAIDAIRHAGAVLMGVQDRSQALAASIDLDGLNIHLQRDLGLVDGRVLAGDNRRTGIQRCEEPPCWADYVQTRSVA